MVEFLEGIWPWLLANYVPFLVFYLIGGVAYAVGKWTLLLFKLRNKVLSIDDTMVKNYRRDYTSTTNGVDDEEVVRKIRKSLAYQVFEDNSYPPQISRNKGNFVAWALFWPINLIWTMIADVATEFFSYIHRKWTGFLQYLSNKITPQ